MDQKTHEELIKTAKILKTEARAIDSKVNTHNILLESINAVNLQNRETMHTNTFKLNKAILKLSKDPRNFIILVLVLVVVMFLMYLWAF